MTPEEEFNKNVWYVLQEIHKKSLYLKKGEPIKYELDHSVIVAGLPSTEEEEGVLYKLQEWKAIKIIDAQEPDDILGGCKILSLWKESEFNKYYDSFKKTCDINSWANAEQEKSYQNLKSGKEINEGATEFLEIDKNLQLSRADRKKLYVIEKLKEEWDLLSKKDEKIYISWQRLIQWEKKCEIDYNQLKNILLSFQDKGLLESFNLYNPAL